MLHFRLWWSFFFCFSKYYFCTFFLELLVIYLTVIFFYLICVTIFGCSAHLLILRFPFNHNEFSWTRSSLFVGAIFCFCRDNGLYLCDQLRMLFWLNEEYTFKYMLNTFPACEYRNIILYIKTILVRFEWYIFQWKIDKERMKQDNMCGCMKICWNQSANVHMYTYICTNTHVYTWICLCAGLCVREYCLIKFHVEREGIYLKLANAETAKHTTFAHRHW